MTFDWKHILLAIALGIAVVGWILWGVQGCTKNKVIQSLNDSLKLCQNAPVKVHDSIHDSIIYRDRWHTPKPVPYPVYIDTVKPKWCEQHYDDSLVIFDGKLRGIVKYKAISKDCQLKINPYESHFPILERTITKTILKDTCNKAKVSIFDWRVAPRVAYLPFNNSFGVLCEGEISLWDRLGLVVEIGATTKWEPELNFGIEYEFHKK